MNSFPFKWQNDSLKYLGTCTFLHTSALYHLNYVPLLNTVKSDLHAWSSLSFSWFCRIYVLEMYILPKLLYIFKTIIIKVPWAFFHRLHSMASKFL